jgi:hypothetical protein
MRPLPPSKRGSCQPFTGGAVRAGTDDYIAALLLGRPSRVHTAVMVHAAPVVLSGLLPISLQGRPVSLLLAWPRVPTRCHGRPQTVACHGDPGLPSSRTRMTELSPMMMPTFMIGASRFRARRHPVQDLPTVRPRR